MDEANGSVESAENPKSSRRKARAAVLRLLYARELRGEAGGFTPEDDFTLHDLLEVPRDDDHLPYIRRMVRAVEKSAAELDERIAPLLRGWTIERLTRVDRLILRFAAYEMLREPPEEADDPGAVVIAAAIDMARVYSTDEAMPFVNGVLGALNRNT
ncbi:MAG: transcription antitermination factor NusB [Oscillospiraceae bacterium]|jgi:N utilization substance protein B|nr:transcription antitermination factor NusB [Oscillospiraceae bacterium]